MSDPEPEQKKLTNEQRRHSSIQTGGKTINTVVGPIHEWLPIPENLPKHPTMAFFGKRRTGKSTSITNVAYHCCQNIPFGLVMSDTAYAVGLQHRTAIKRHPADSWHSPAHFSQTTSERRRGVKSHRASPES